MKLRICLFVLAISLNLTRCNVAQYATNTYIETWRQLDIDASGTEKTGHIAVTDGKNLYYFTDEYDRTGIYQMSLDGGTGILLVEEKDIGQIQLAEEKLYYSSFIEIYYGNEEKGNALGNKSYSLKSFDLSSREVNVLDCGTVFASELEKFPDQGIDPNRGLVNFHYCGDDIFMLSSVETMVPTRRFGMFTGFILENQFARIEDLFEIRDFGGEVERFFCKLYFNDNVIIVPSVTHQASEGILCTMELYIYDKQGNYGYRSPGAINYNMNQLKYPEQTVSMINSTQALITSGNSILLCEPESGVILDHIELPSVKGLMYAESVSIVIAYEKDEKTQSLYRLDAEDFSVKKIAAFENEDIVSITEDYIVTAADHVLRKYTLHDSQVMKEWEKIYPESFDQVDIAIEVCADWLFVKKFDGKKGTLLNKEKLSIY